MKISITMLFLSICILALYLFAQPKLVTYYPDPSSAVVTNPYIGFAPPARGGPYAISHSLVYANITWRELEATKGKYQFEEVERELQKDYWKGKNVKIIIRLVMDYPSSESHLDIPDWLFQEIEGKGTWYETEWGKGFSPDYTNQVLIENHRKLIQALGERYNQDNQIAFIELGSIGHWGEWHTYQDKDLYIPFPLLKVSNQYVQPYVDYLGDKSLLMRRPYPLAKQHGMGLFNDMFSSSDSIMKEFTSWHQEGYVFWLTGEKHPAMKDFWKKAPAGGEFDPSQTWQTHFSTSNIELLLDKARQSHISWLGPNVPPYMQDLTKEDQKNMEKFLQTIGYHFTINEVSIPESSRAGNTVQGTLLLENRGTAPFYFDWPVEIALLDERGVIATRNELKMNVRDLLPGIKKQSFEINLPRYLPKGNYQLAIAIMDPDTEKPGILWELKERTPSGWYMIGPLEIK